MIRKVIKIDEEKCTGCGLCANTCHEGAIGIINGKAKLLRDDYCDGFGDCLPSCPAGAISFEEREAAAYDEKAVNAHKEVKHAFSGCPGSMAKVFHRQSTVAPVKENNINSMDSELMQWPVQIKLVSPKAPYFDNANLLIAADCTAFSYGNFHKKFIKNHIVLIGCPKLDDVDYSEKLTEIISNNNIKSINVVRMEVPCCGGIENAVKKALINCGKMIPWQVTVISTDGEIVED